MSRSERLVVAVTGPYHGLGNRMRVVLGAQALARLEGRSFRYVWPIGRGFGARLDELWEFHARRWPTALSRALRAVLPVPGRRPRLDRRRSPAGTRLADPHAARAGPPTRRTLVARVAARPPARGGDPASDPGAVRGIRRPPLPRRHDPGAHGRTRRDPAGVTGGVVPLADRADPHGATRPRPLRRGRHGCRIRAGRPSVPRLRGADRQGRRTTVVRRCRPRSPTCTCSPAPATSSDRTTRAFPSWPGTSRGAAVALETSTSAPATRFEAQGEPTVGTPLRPELRSPGRN